jgi:hypothetical protein
MNCVLGNGIDIKLDLRIRFVHEAAAFSVAFVMAGPVRKRLFGNLDPEESEMAAFVLADDQEVDLSLDLRDRFGNPTKPVSAPSWEVSDRSLLSIKPAPDGLSCLVQAVGKVGSAQVSVKIPRSSTPGDFITGVQDFSIGSSETTFVGLVSGTARPIGEDSTTTTKPNVTPTTVSPGPQGAQGPQGVQSFGA